MIDFICNLARNVWNFYINLHHWFAGNISEKAWVQCLVGVVLVAVAFVLARTRWFQMDDSGDDIDILPNDGWAILGMGFLFVVMFFNDFLPWHMVTGFAGFFAWLGMIFHLCWLGVPLLVMGVMVVQLIFELIKTTFKGNFYYLDTIRIICGVWLRPIIGMVITFPLLNIGLLLTSGVSAPLFVGIFFLAALLMPSSNKWGEVTDRNGNVWEVWKW